MTMWTTYLFLASILLALCLTTLAAWSDMRSLTIPNWISLAICAIYPVVVLTSPIPVDWLWSLFVFFSVFVIGFLLFVIGALGGGDVKLISALSLWAGLGGLGPFILTTVLAGGLLVPIFLFRGAKSDQNNDAGFLRKIRTQLRAKLKIPYGIAIAAGSVPIFLQYARSAYPLI